MNVSLSVLPPNVPNNGPPSPTSPSGVPQAQLPRVPSFRPGEGFAAGSRAPALEYQLIRRQTRLSVWIVALSAVGIVLMVAENEVLYNVGSRLLRRRMAFVLEVLLSASSLACMLCVVRYHQLSAQLLRLKMAVPPTDKRWPPRLVLLLVAELVVVAVHPIPLADPDEYTQGTLSDVHLFASVFMVMRYFQVPRVVKYLSRLYGPAGRFIGALTKVSMDSSFIIKTIMDDRPLALITSLLATTLLTCSYAVYIAERHAGRSDVSFADALWSQAVTASTVGYGDIVIFSHVGRLFSVATAFFGILLSALSIAIIHRKMQLTIVEGRMVDFLREDKGRRLIKTLAARCIQRAWRFHAAPRGKVALRRARERTLFAVLREWKALKARLRRGDASESTLVQTFVAELQPFETRMANLEEHMESIEVCLLGGTVQLHSKRESLLQKRRSRGASLAAGKSSGSVDNPSMLSVSDLHASKDLQREVGDLSARVSGLEGKLDKILELLERGSSGKGF